MSQSEGSPQAPGLREAATLAVMPLEVIVRSGRIHDLTPELQQAIHDGIAAVKSALLEGQQGSKTPNPKKDLEGGDAPREIKFRMWQGGKMWPVGELQFFDDGSVCINGEVPREVSGVALMQFTGLKDANGRDIYEGDILEFMPGDYHNLGRVLRGVVVFLQGAFGMEIGKENGWYDLGRAILDDEAKVLGHIHETIYEAPQGEAREAAPRGESPNPQNQDPIPTPNHKETP